MHSRKIASPHQFTLAMIFSSFVAVPVYADSTVSDNSSGESDWFKNVDKTQEEQPHWMTPLVTITPRLEEEYRYDQTWQNKPGDTTLTNYGGGKGLELIPSENVETIIGQPGYLVQQSPKATTQGWSDESFLIKYRFLSQNEEHGNYIVTGFLGLSTATGGPPYTLPFTTNQTVVTPTIAVGKGWGTRQQGFDIQSTLGASVPNANQYLVGLPISWNTSFQGHYGMFWPEIETSYTHWKSGPFGGRSQLITTYGLILGRFPLVGRTRLIIGAGYQAASGTYFSTYQTGWVTSMRVAF